MLWSCFIPTELAAKFAGMPLALLYQEPANEQSGYAPASDRGRP